MKYGKREKENPSFCYHHCVTHDRDMMYFIMKCQTHSKFFQSAFDMEMYKEYFSFLCLLPFHCFYILPFVFNIIVVNIIILFFCILYFSMSMSAYISLCFVFLCFKVIFKYLLQIYNDICLLLLFCIYFLYMIVIIFILCFLI